VLLVLITAVLFVLITLLLLVVITAVLLVLITAVLLVLITLLILVLITAVLFVLITLLLLVVITAVLLVLITLLLLVVIRHCSLFGIPTWLATFCLLSSHKPSDSIQHTFCHKIRVDINAIEYVNNKNYSFHITYV